jgi:hypothetical protein
VYFLGVKAADAFCAVVMKSGNLNFLELSGPLQEFNGTALSFIISSYISHSAFTLYCNRCLLREQNRLYISTVRVNVEYLAVTTGGIYRYRCTINILVCCPLEFECVVIR